jgi:type III secretion protein T
MEADPFAHLVSAMETFKHFQQWLALLALAGLRFYVMALIVPVFAPDVFTGTVRNGFVIAMSAFVALGTPPELMEQVSGVGWLAFAAKEALLGAALGFVLAAPFWVAEGVGAMIDMQTGYNNVQHTNPLSGQEATPVAQLLLHVLVAVFCAAGGLMLVVGTMMESFVVWPLTAPMPSLEGLGTVFLPQQTDSLMGLIVKFAAPMLLALLLVDLGVGFITRSADKLEPHSLGQPLKGAVAMLMLALLLGVFVDQLRGSIVPGDIVVRLKQLF